MHASCISQWFINFNLLPTYMCMHTNMYIYTLSLFFTNTHMHAHTVIMNNNIANCSLVAARVYLAKTETGCSKSGLSLIETKLWELLFPL